jgi:adenylate cyclase
LIVAIGLDFNTMFLYQGNYDQSSNKIVIIKIDNKSLDALQKSDLRVLNLSKTVFANTIEKLEEYGAKAIGIDVIFANQSDDANKLRNTLEKYKNIVIGAKIGNQDKDNESQVLPLPIYSGGHWGAIDVHLSKNVVNKIQPIYTLSGRSIESMSIGLYRASISANESIGELQSWKYTINPLRSIPLNPEWSALIRFFHPPEGYPSYSLIDVLEDRIDPAIFYDKFVLIGEYGTLIHDAHFSPIDHNIAMPGVEFHANMLDSILQGKFLRDQTDRELMVSLVLLILLLVVFFFRFSTRISAIFFFSLFIGVFIFARWIFAAHGIVLNLFAYFISITTTFVVSTLYRYFIVNKKRRFIELAFSRYLAPEIVREIWDHPDTLKLWWEKREITIFFSDIAGFTTISELLGAEKLFSVLSEYLSEMTNILIANKGTLDKYIGDAVMGFFNAPLTIDNPAYHACTTALEQQKAIKTLNEKWSLHGIPPINARIGINTGEAIVGNIGSQDRFSYTAIGDSVNLAARLEWVNKEYGTFICVSESTYLQAKDQFSFRELDTIKVKWKTKWVKIYELLGYKDGVNNVEKYATYDNALSLYYSSSYAEARKIFMSISGDDAAIMMAERCQDALDGAIEVIDGIYEMKEK